MQTVPTTSSTRRHALTFTPAESFLTSLWISIYFGFVLALPVIFWQVWQFFVPAVDKAHAKLIKYFVFLAWVLAVVGLVFGYFIVLPAALQLPARLRQRHLLQQPAGQAVPHLLHPRRARDGARLRAAAVRRRAHAPRASSRPTGSAGTAASATSSSPASRVALPGVDPVTVVLRDAAAADPLRDARSGSPSCSTAAPTHAPAGGRRRRDVTAVSADWVLPVDGPPLRDALVAWEDGRIVEVAAGRAERHFEGAMILPGLVNAHSHLEYAVYAGFGDGQRLRRLARHAHRAQARARRTTRWSRSPAAEPPTRSRPGSRRRPTTASRAPPRRRPPSSACARSSTSRSSAPTRSRPRATSTSCAAASPESELVQIGDLAARALHLLARRLPLVPLARDPGRDAPRRERGGERVARLAAPGRSTAIATVPRRADRPARRRDARATCSAPNFSARTASTSTMTRSQQLARPRRPGRALPALECAARLRHRAARRPARGRRPRRARHRLARLDAFVRRLGGAAHRRVHEPRTRAAPRCARRDTPRCASRRSMQPVQSASTTRSEA